MTPKLSKDITDALHASDNGQVEAVDPDTGRVYFVVDGEIHQRAMKALRHQQDQATIAQYTQRHSTRHRERAAR